MKRHCVRRIASSAVALAIVFAGARPVAGAVIPVTTVEQKISSAGGCSLQEAIYSANYDASVAVQYVGTTAVLIQTQCVAGSGDDSIVLPAGAVFQLSKIVDDADNPTGPTATPIIFSKITLFAYGAILQRTGSKNFRLSHRTSLVEIGFGHRSLYVSRRWRGRPAFMDRQTAGRSRLADHPSYGQ